MKDKKKKTNGFVRIVLRLEDELWAKHHKEFQKWWKRSAWFKVLNKIKK